MFIFRIIKKTEPDINDKTSFLYLKNLFKPMLTMFDQRGKIFQEFPID